MIEVRRLEPDEWPLWRELRLAALADAPDAFGSTLAGWIDAPAQRWIARLEAAVNLIGHLDGDPCGMCSLMPGEQGMMLAAFWVAPPARGRGLSDALIAAAQERAVAEGVPALILDVRRANGRARNTYARAGFRERGPEHPASEPDEVQMIWLNPAR